MGTEILVQDSLDKSLRGAIVLVFPFIGPSEDYRQGVRVECPVGKFEGRGGVTVTLRAGIGVREDHQPFTLQVRIPAPECPDFLDGR
ncbi:hypothetical protein EBZ80_02920 [bacterium]|nr:hypothetical protein [bacterium]